jgi:hypothetical protein
VRQVVKHLGHHFAQLGRAPMHVLCLRPIVQQASCSRMNSSALSRPAWRHQATSCAQSDMKSTADGVPTGSELTAYLAQLTQIDPITDVALIHASLLVQMGEDDFSTPRHNFLGFHAVTPLETSRLATYESQHPMDTPVIRLDRDLWLRALLGLASTAP